MSDEEWMCCLMFDEMSPRQNLHFNSKFDCIEGYEDLGSHVRTSYTANQALVFILHGLHKKWKPPVAYYSIHTSTKIEMLVNFLLEVLDACQNAGLEVVATFCDMGANSVKTLMHLGVSEKTPVFKFQCPEVAAIFDPPSHLICTHKLFVTHDIANMECQVTANGE